MTVARTTRLFNLEAITRSGLEQQAKVSVRHLILTLMIFCAIQPNMAENLICPLALLSPEADDTPGEE